MLTHDPCNPRVHPARLAQSVSPICICWGNAGPERLHDLPKVIQLVLWSQSLSSLLPSYIASYVERIMNQSSFSKPFKKQLKTMLKEIPLPWKWNCSTWGYVDACTFSPYLCERLGAVLVGLAGTMAKSRYWSHTGRGWRPGFTADWFYDPGMWLTFSFLICRMGIIIPTLGGYCED